MSGSLENTGAPEHGKTNRQGWKIAVVVGICLIVGAGGIGAVAVPWANANGEAANQETTNNTPPKPAAAAKPIEWGSTPIDGASQVNPVTPAVVKAVNGTIKNVALIDDKTGIAVPGTLNANKSTWTAAEPLKFDTSYSYTFTGVDAADRESSKSQKFSTVPAANEADAASYVRDGGNIGVGQPVQLTFSEPVLNKAAVESAIKITSSAGQLGAFRWIGDKTVRYRPEVFWTANSVVTIDMKLFGVDFGNGQIGNFNKAITMNVGDKRVLVADSANHVANFYLNDQLIRTMPVTMGDTRFPSSAGYLVMMDKQKQAVFNADTIGLKPDDPAYYGNKLDVSNAIRISNSGEFVHQALPGAYASLGNTNVSHGCIGLSPENATWIFDTMTTGDVVQVINTEGGPTALDDGFGDWNIPWAQYPSQG